MYYTNIIINFYYCSNEAEGQLHIPSCRGTVEDVERMRIVLAQNPCAVNQPQGTSKYMFIAHDHGPLYDAAILHHTLCVKFLLEAGADPNAICPEEKLHPLEAALDSPYEPDEPTEVVELLLRAGGSPNNTWNAERPRTGLLRTVIESNRNDCLRVLLQYGADIEAPISGEMPQGYDNKYYFNFASPLTFAVKHLNAKAMFLLFLHGSDFKFRKGFYNCLRKVGNEMQSIPHFMLFYIERCIAEPIVFNILHTNLEAMIYDATKAIQVYKLCGGNMWTKAKDPQGERYLPEENILQLLKRRPELDQLLAPLTQKMRELMSTGPLRLRDECRLVVQQCMGNNYIKYAHDLGLPKCLEQFLRFEMFDGRIK